MASLSTPGSFGTKKNLLKSLVKRTKPSVLSTKKASIKGILAKASGKAMKATPALTGGSPFPLNGGLGTPDSAQINPAQITSGAGANLGKVGTF